ncbi:MULTISPECIES: hypothetical protein [unclassified Paraburkholderia]|uniref:hypothetical protein n=2 Tax=Burkholderiaceae TaxID=119060 RepID=UPI001820D45F|nr:MULTISPECIES: hypothetical protein [unclassified Paraburkholderia]MBB5407609.1 hypothetical protein [Paraburkholderia sp. HC6.4b]MBB5453634.1 hypothetical protein [Paraburkholderia sp. Kb1A]
MAAGTAEARPDERGGRAGFEQPDFRQPMKKNNQQHVVVLVVLISQIAFLAMFAFAEPVVRHNRWLAAGFGFDFLFGLILSVGFVGMWRTRAVDSDFLGFLLANPVDLAIVIATAGQLVAILLV